MSLRYSRQELFEKIGKSGQKKIGKAVICIVGCGALGSSNAEILARAGVKKLILIDDDLVEISNLQRQALYEEKDVGKPKVESLKSHLKRINSNVEIQVFNQRLTKEDIKILESDILLDGTDNLDTRFLINEYAIKNNIPYVFGSAVKSEGMVFPIIEGGPCLECILKGKKGFETSDTAGILATTIRMTSSLQCTQAIKIMIGEEPSKELIRFNIWENEFQKIKVKKNPDCDNCNQ